MLSPVCLFANSWTESLDYLSLSLSLSLFQYWGFPGGAVVKTPTANVGDTKYWFNPWVGKIPWRRKWQATPVFLPGKSHGQRSLVGCSPGGHKELNKTEQLSMYEPLR